MKNKDKVELVRYLRNWELDLDLKIPVISSNGGITFYFEIDQINQKLSYAYAICNTCDNFDRKIGRETAKERFDEKGKYFKVIDYYRNESLVKNVLEDLVIEKTKADLDNVKWANEQHTFFKHVIELVSQRDYIEHNYPWILKK